MAKTIRDIYGEALVEYGTRYPQLVVLDADVSSSSKSCIFGEAFPERFFNMGIAEANMVGVAAGLACMGKIPFANAFGVFITSLGLLPARAFGSYSQLNIKLVGAYGGLSDAYDGASHHALEDIAIMRSLPNFEVYVASDAALTRWLVRNAVERATPMYIRLSREAIPDIYTADTVFAPGMGNVLKEGTDATIIACGTMTGQAVQAAQRLEQKGLRVGVVDMYCIKPLDSALVLQAAATGAVVTAEEHSVIGGLGSAVAEVLSQNGVHAVQEFVGTKDQHTQSGPYSQLLARYGLDADAIEAAVERAVQRSR